MAASGSTSVAFTSWDTLKFSWWEESQSIANNSTVVAWKLELIATAYGRIDTSTANSKEYSIVVNGTTYSGKNNIAISNNTTKTLVSGKTTITHGSDGKKTFSYSFTQQIKINFSDTYIGTKSGSGSGTLTTIPRKATITSAENFTDEENPFFYYSNPAGKSVDSLQACISFTGAKDDIPYRDIPKTGTSAAIRLNASERDILRNATTGGNSRTVRIYIRTIIGDVVERHYVPVTLTIVDCAPVLFPSVRDIGEASTRLTGDPENTMIKGYNTMSVSTGAVARKGASITSQRITCGGKTIDGGSGQFDYANSNVFTFSATDNRGNTTTQTVTIPNFIQYFKPTCDFRPSSPTPKGTMYLKIEGWFYNGSLGTVQNEIHVKYRYKESGSNYPSEWASMTPVLGDNSYISEVTLEGLDFEATYVFQIKVDDTVSLGHPAFSITSPERVVKSRPIFDWGREDFRVNGCFSVRRGSSHDNTAYHQIGLGHLDSDDDWRFYIHANGDFSIDSVNSETGEWMNRVFSLSKTDVLSDFVIEHGERTVAAGDGVQTTWVYKKWKSGTAEAWCYSAHKYVLDDTGQFSFDIPYPFNIRHSIPVVQGSVDCWRCHKPIWVTNDDVRARVYLYTESLPDDINNAIFGVHVHVYGWWT